MGKISLSDAEFQLFTHIMFPDYTNPKPNETVSLALRKLPATAPVADRLGSLL